MKIYRVVGGRNPGKSLNDYQIIEYEVIKETGRYYWVESNGLPQLQQKRETTNSRLFTDKEEAEAYFNYKIHSSIHRILASIPSMEEIQNDPDSTLYIVNFNKEMFTLSKKSIEKTTDTGWKIYPDEFKEIITPKGKVIRKHIGRVFIQRHVSKEHNPSNPCEKWIGEKNSEIFEQIQKYAHARIAYITSSAYANNNSVSGI